MSVGVVDCGIGNLKSLSFGLERIGCDFKISSNPQDIAEYDKIILPGVGSFGHAVNQIDKLGFREMLADVSSNPNKKILGICLGMQLFFETSDESRGAKGLGLINGHVTRLDPVGGNIPHMGWNNIEKYSHQEYQHLSEIPDLTDFYFVHSFALHDAQIERSCLTSRNDKSFISYLEHQNITCAQFHPEKSHDQGLKLLKNWANS